MLFDSEPRLINETAAQPAAPAPTSAPRHNKPRVAKEDTENFRQLCIREEQSAKFLPYVACILNSTDVNNPGNVTACMKGLGIDTVKVDDCMKNNAASYYAVDSKLSQDYGVQGSPTLIINGATSSAGRR